MPKPRTITRAVYDYLASDPDVKETIRDWIDSEPDPERRALLFAVRLSEDLTEDMRALGRGIDGDLHTAWVEEASARVNWQRIAETLLHRFSQPEVEEPAPRSHWTVWATPGSID